MKKQRILFTALAAVILSVGVVGCGGQAAQPVAIDEKVDRCDVCHMMVKDDQFAVELVQKNDKVLKFDDLGCLVKWTNNNGEDQVETQFVRDYHSEEWVELADATYVFDKDIVTPMAYNVISFKAKSDAESFLEKQGRGELLTSEDLDKHVWEQNKDMIKKKKEEMMKKKMQGGHGNGMPGSGTEAKPGM